VKEYDKFHSASAASVDGLTEDFDTLVELGDCYVSVENYRQAQLCYDRAADLDPDRCEPYVGIGAIAFQQGGYDDAANAYRVALRLDPANGRAHCGLAMVYQACGTYSEAFDSYLKCLELDTDNLTALLGLFQTSCQMGSFEKVTYFLEVYLRMHPGDNAVMFCLATLYVKDGRLNSARGMLIDVLDADGENADAAALLEEVEHALARKT